MGKNSKQVLMVVALHIMFIAILCILVFREINNISIETRLINYSGLARGTIQRVAKLEASGVESDALIGDVAAYIREMRKLDFMLGTRHDKQKMINDLVTKWDSLKKQIYIFRKSGAESGRRKIIAGSENCWAVANEITFHIQHSSQSKLRFAGIASISVLLYLLVAILALHFLNTYVQKRMRALADFDALTGIYNRRIFDLSLENELHRAERYERPLALIVLDIDHFKLVNDSHGHQTGDRVLREIAAIIKNNIRKEDIFCRIGGEEFAIITPETDISGAEKMAQKLREKIESHNFRDIGQITVSGGIAENCGGFDVEYMFKLADQSLYRAKHLGRNRIEVKECPISGHYDI